MEAFRPGQSGRGWFIAFEGIDGSGKSTQVGRLVRRLQDAGMPTFATGEPSGGPIGALIRQALSGRTILDERVMVYLYAADRLDHVLNEHDGMLRTLEAGTTVVSDRYHLSTLAYHTDVFDLATIAHFNSIATDLLLPDLVVFLDVSPEAGLHRLATAGGGRDRYERLETLHRVRAAYEAALSTLPPTTRLVTIHGEETPDLIAETVWAAVLGLVGGSAIKVAASEQQSSRRATD